MRFTYDYEKPKKEPKPISELLKHPDGWKLDEGSPLEEPLALSRDEGDKTLRIRIVPKKNEPKS